MVYDEVEYPGSLTVIGYENDDAPVKTFNQESSFFGIEVGDKLGCDEVVIPNVPVAALDDEMMHLTAFVNLVMNSQQDFYMDFSYVAGGPGEVPEVPESTPDDDSSSDGTQQEDGTWLEEKQVAITASVSESEANAPSYAITIPTDVALGEISSDADTTINYSIGLDLGDHESIAISVAESGSLTSGSDTLAYTNTLTTKDYTANGSATGQLTIAQADGAAAMNGGSLSGVASIVNGNISMKNWSDVNLLSYTVLPTLFVSFFLAKRCDVLSLEDKTVQSVGIHVGKTRLVLSIVAVLLASFATAVVGMISFLGLLVPNLARLMVGSRHSILLPFSALLGAVFFLATDTLGRTIAHPYEISAAILMSVVGGPVFILLMQRSGLINGT